MYGIVFLYCVLDFMIILLLLYSVFWGYFFIDLDSNIMFLLEVWIVRFE